MFAHFVLAVCQIVIACIMLGALVVVIFAIREGSLSLLDWLETIARRRRQRKLDRQQSHQYEEFNDGYDFRSK